MAKAELRQRPALWIRAPLLGYTVRTGVVERASAEIRFEERRIRTVDIPVAGKIPIAGVVTGTRSLESTSAKIQFKGCCVAAVNVLVTVKIALAFADISTPIPPRGIGVYLVRIAQ